MSAIKVIPGQTRRAKVEAIFSAAFAPMKMRDPRSKEYMQGAYTALENASSAGDTDFTLKSCPFNAGSCAFDAWHAGYQEGRNLWRINGHKS